MGNEQTQEYICCIEEDKVDSVLKYMADRGTKIKKIGTNHVYLMTIRPSELKEYEKVPGIKDITENENISMIRRPGPGVIH